MSEPASGAPQSSVRAHMGGLREKLVRASVFHLALIGVATLLVVAVVEYRAFARDQKELERQIRDTLNVRGESLSRSHASVFQSYVRDASFGEMRATVAGAVAGEGVVYGVFVDADGRPLAYCSPRTPCRQNPDEEVRLVEEEQVANELALTASDAQIAELRVRERYLFGVPVLEFALPIVVEGERAGILRYGISKVGLHDALAQVRADRLRLLLTSLGTIFLAVLLALGVGVVLARRLARWITRPIGELMVASHKLASGDRAARVGIASGDELERLGQAFNQMAGELQHSYSALETRNLELRREIEERKQIQAEKGQLQSHLAQAQKMEAFGQLAGGVAHDFNNILAVVIGNSELLELLLMEGQTDEAVEVNRQVAQAAERGANLTRQLLTFARRESDSPRLLNVNETIGAFEKLIRRVIEESIQVTVSMTSPLSPVVIDPGRLEQVVMNLCVNARDAMSGGGRLAVKTREAVLTTETSTSSGMAPPGTYVVISTSDDGQGIPPEIVDRVFEPFFTTKAAGKGTGLGLATVHGIVEDAGGFIDIDTRLGEGTTFDVYLPAAEGRHAEEGSLRPEGAPFGQGQRILLCEDDLSVQAMVARILERGGYEVTRVSSGADAIDALQHEEFELLLTDVVMPEMDGGALSNEARELRPQMPVLLVSGYTGGVLENCGVKEDSINFLRKPFRSRELLERVHAVIAAEALS